MANEPLPADDLLSQFNSQWNTSNVAKPNSYDESIGYAELKYDGRSVSKLNDHDELISYDELIIK